MTPLNFLDFNYIQNILAAHVKQLDKKLSDIKGHLLGTDEKYKLAHDRQLSHKLILKIETIKEYKL